MRRRFFKRFSKCVLGSQSKCEATWVNHVRLPIFKHKADWCYWISSLGAFLARLMEGFLNRRDILIRDVLSLGFVNKLALSWWILFYWNRLYVANNFGILTRSSWLLFMGIIKSSIISDSLTVINARVSHLHINSVLTSKTLSVYLQMKLTHSTYNHFFAFEILSKSESWILSHKSIESIHKSRQFCYLFRLNIKWHDCLRYMHWSHWNILQSGECLAWCTINTKKSENIASSCLVDILHLIRVHPHHSWYFNSLFCACVEN